MRPAAGAVPGVREPMCGAAITGRAGQTGATGRIAWAGVLMGTRFVVLPVIWLFAFEVGNRTIYGWPRPAGPIAWGLYLPSDPEVIAMLLLMIAIARVFVFAARGVVSGTLLVMLVIGSAAWAAWAAGGDNLSGPGFVQFALAAAMVASLAISAGWWCLVRVLPRRKVAMLEDAFTPSRGSLAAGSRNADEH